MRAESFSRPSASPAARRTAAVLEARLLATATAVPPHALGQDEVAEAAARLFGGRLPDYARLARVFATAGIVKRQAVRPIAWFLEPRGWPERTAVYLEAGAELFVAAAERALARAGLAAAEVDTIVTVSSTGIATPSLEARVAGRMGFRPDVARVPVFGLGCAGGVSGLALAARLALSRRGEVVLLVALELCTLAFRLDTLSKENIVATALFGDGAAACVLRGGERGEADGALARVEAAGQHTWPDTLDIMGWRVDPEGFGVIFDRAIPPFAEERLGPAMAAMLGAAGLGMADVGRFVCHPGGVKVIAALEQALGLGTGALAEERAVLADYGNMSAPTVLFVLERVLARGLDGRAAVIALGPGFTAACVTLLPPR